MTALRFTSLRALLAERRRRVVAAALALAGTATLVAGIHFDSGLLQALGYAVLVRLSTQAVAVLLTQPETRRRGRSA
jgi:hypothetical protein